MERETKAEAKKGCRKRSRKTGVERAREITKNIPYSLSDLVIAQRHGRNA
ncbi:hypothetical protein KAW55_04240 [bacterium]|nr:hypothetical protein [bacterium]